MHRTHQRRQQRVAYAASVRLHTSGRPHPFEARSINLSRSGVLVESLQPCAIGTEVICEIPLPGGRRQLRGRVARLQCAVARGGGPGASRSPASTALDEELLSEAVGQDDGRTRVVQVRFEGMARTDAQPRPPRRRRPPAEHRPPLLPPALARRGDLPLGRQQGAEPRPRPPGRARSVRQRRHPPAGGECGLRGRAAGAARRSGGSRAGLGAPPTVPELPAMAATPSTSPTPSRPSRLRRRPSQRAAVRAVVRVLMVAAAVALLGTGALTYLRGQAPVAEHPTAVPPPW